MLLDYRRQWIEEVSSRSSEAARIPCTCPEIQRYDDSHPWMTELQPCTLRTEKPFMLPPQATCTKRLISQKTKVGITPPALSDFKRSITPITPYASVTTTIRRPFDCLSKVIEVTVTQPDSQSCWPIYLFRSQCTKPTTGNGRNVVVEWS